MKIAEYNQMMAYLTRPEPEVLPQPKPQELLDIQEQNKIERQQDTMDKASPFLMDESVDFIERQNFAVKGFVTPPDPSVPKDFLEEFIAQQGVDSWEEINTAQRSRFNNQVVERIKQFKKDTKGLISRQELADLIGVDNDYLRGISKSQAYKGGRNPKYDLIVEVLEDSKKIYRPVTGQNLGYYKKPSAADIKKVKSILDADVLSGKVINRVNTLSNNKKFMNMLKNKKLTDKEFLPKTKAMFPNLDLTDKKLADAVLLIARGSEGANLTGVNLKSDKGLSKKLLKQFETAKWGNPFHEAAYKYASTKIDEQLGSKVGTFKSYQGAINKKLNDLGIDAKNYNVDEFVGVSIGGKQKAGPYSTFTQVTDAKYNQGPAAAYQGKLSQASTELSNIINEYGSDSKQAKNLVKKFNETTALNHENKYNTKVAKLDLKSPEKSFGKKRFTELGSLGEQLTSSFEEKGFGYKIPKGAKTQKELLSGKNIEKIIASIACPGKAMGGRIGFQDGTSCFEKGKKMINTGNIPEGAAKKNFINFANKAMEIGKQSGRGLRTITKFGVLPEAIIIGADTLIRTGMGDTLNEAFLRASDIYRTDDAYEQADASEINRRMNSNDGELILNLRKFNNERAKLSSLEQQKEADLTLAGDDFAETNSGMTEDEIEKFYAPKIQEQENNLFNASISDAEERAGLAKETEFEDKKGVAYKKSIIGKPLDDLAEVRGFKQVADFFATEARGEPDVSAQTLENYLSDKIPQEQEKKLRNIIDKGGARGVLDAMKKIEASQQIPEGAIREPNVFDEERKILFDLAKTDPALAERLGGASMTFFGDPIDSTDLQDEMNLDRGIYSQGGRIGYSSGSDGTALAIEASLEAFQRYLKAGGKLSYKDFIAVGGEGVSKFFNSGGRVGFKDGPKNPGRRTFIKGMGILAALPFIGKFIKPAAPLVKKLANSNTVMPDWFPNFVDKFVGRSIGKKIDADLMEYTNPDLPNIKLTRKDDGSILVEGKNEFNEAYNISYEPPGYELIDETTGKAVKTKGEFEAVEGRHVAMGPDDYDTDAFYAEDLDELFTSDIADMEKYATGNVTKTVKDAFGTETGLKKGKYDVDMAQGRAENQADILRDEGLDEID